MKRCLIYLLLWICWLPQNMPLGYATELTRSKQELTALQERIEQVKQSLEKELDQADSITSELDHIEQSLASLNQSIRRQQDNKTALESEVQQLSAKSKTLTAQNKDAQERLSKLVKSGYMMGQQSGLKLLLNQQNPHILSRKLMQFRYVMTARNQQLQQITASQQVIKENQVLLVQRKQQLEQTSLKIQAEKEQLKSQDIVRTRALKAVKKQIASNETSIALYQKREVALKKLLQEIIAVQRQTTRQKAQETVTQTNQATTKTTQSVKILSGFNNNRGRLPHPIVAKVRFRFGQKKQQSGLPLEGLLYHSQAGQSVKVIYPGQVVFSDWFRGYGQLVVINHGDGYMSIYGNNQSLAYNVGETVEAGQVIATASASSNEPSLGLYFEIRHNGTPTDPLQWIR